MGYRVLRKAFTFHDKNKNNQQQSSDGKRDEVFHFVSDGNRIGKFSLANSPKSSKAFLSYALAASISSLNLPMFFLF